MFGINLNRKTWLFILVAVLVFLFHRNNDIRYLSRNVQMILFAHVALTLYLIHTHRYNENFKNSIKRIAKF